MNVCSKYRLGKENYYLLARGVFQYHEQTNYWG
ncbi:hypothetical protein Hmuk_2279 [Halomicrobium mukohataei DSM 12286]|uniref:Uncharacterized protein n=1 Tax=Halomicrobium mukohataei (strain ATCC 700874 / DSM 12286 / JCM 9738 / NCIMB 13541) TaxID=485914 RepID=C7NXF7_HALMD|nr:hypothetical protein Hmuk_2279 [Halomicrobium mukohataei DSM 12286]